MESHGLDHVTPFFGWIDPPASERETVGSEGLGEVPSLRACVDSGWPVRPVRFRDRRLHESLAGAHGQLRAEVLRAGGIEANAFRFVEDGKTRLGTEIVDSVGRLSLDQLDSFGLRSGTRVFVGVEHWHPGFQVLADHVADSLGARTGVSIFESSPGVRGFPAHYDTSHSVLFQLTGSKSWRMWPGPIHLPADEHPWPEVSHLYPDGALEDRGRQATVELGAGECLWIPTGWVHQGLSSWQGSAHVTLGIRPSRLFEVLQHMADSAASVPAMRRQLEPSDSGQSSDEQEVAREVVAALARSVDEVPLPQLSEVLGDYLRYVAQRPTPD